MRTTVYEIANEWIPILSILVFFILWMTLGFRVAATTGGLMLIFGLVLSKYDSFMHRHPQNAHKHGTSDMQLYVFNVFAPVSFFDAVQSNPTCFEIKECNPGIYKVKFEMVRRENISELTAIQARHESAAHEPRWSLAANLTVPSGVLCIAVGRSPSRSDRIEKARFLSSSAQPFLADDSYLLCVPQYGSGEYAIHVDHMNGRVLGFRINFS